MRIATTGFISSHRTGTLENISREEVQIILNIYGTVEPQMWYDEKVTLQWNFIVTDDEGNEHECSIWDWKGSESFNQYSAFGPHHIMRQLFGAHYREYTPFTPYHTW